GAGGAGGSPPVISQSTLPGGAPAGDSQYDNGTPVQHSSTGGCTYTQDVGLVRIDADCMHLAGNKITIVPGNGGARPHARIAGVDFFGDPGSGGELTIDLATLRITGGAEVRIGDVVLWKGTVDWPLNAPIEFEAPKGAAFKGLPFSGAVKITWDLTHVAVDANLKLPEVFGGVTAHAAIDVDLQHGVKTGEITLTAETLKIKGLSLKKVSIMYDKTTEGDRWSGEVAVVLPGQSISGVEIDGKLVIVNGRFRSVEVTASHLQKHLGYGVFLQEIRARAQVDPFGFGGGATFTFGPQIKSFGLLKAEGDIDIKFGSPAVILVKGKLYLASAKTNSASVEIRTSGTVKLQGTSEVEEGPFKTTIDESGWVEQHAFNATGKAELKVGKITASGGEGAISSVGVVACRRGFGPDVGAGFRWGDHAPTIFASSCDIGPYQAKMRARSAQAGGAQSVEVSAGQPVTAMAFGGAGAPPKVKLTAPDGTVIQTPATDDDALDARSWIVQDAASATTYVAIDAPKAGTWTVEPLPGSVALTDVRQATGLPQPKVSATVTTRRDGRAQLRWTLTPIAGQRVRLMERNSGVARTITVSNAAHGTVTFTPQAGAARARRLEAVVEQDGLPRTTLQLGSFTAAKPPRPGKVHGLHVTRKGRQLRASWRTSTGAAAYEVLVRMPDGSTTLYQPRTPRLAVAIHGHGTASVRVRVITQDRRMSPAVSARLAVK
ncbi:MAG: hypothetical protein JWR30_2075, partial [Conexibacter sp.]|nr:hypothetical protein [Conexibacter sp.]